MNCTNQNYIMVLLHITRFSRNWCELLKIAINPLVHSIYVSKMRLTNYESSIKAVSWVIFTSIIHFIDKVLKILPSPTFYPFQLIAFSLQRWIGFILKDTTLLCDTKKNHNINLISTSINKTVIIKFRTIVAWNYSDFSSICLYINVTGLLVYIIYFRIKLSSITMYNRTFTINSGKTIACLNSCIAQKRS